LLCGLTLKFGAHRFASGILLNAWFLVALAIPAAFQADGVKTGAWPQALAWLIGSAGWIAVTWVAWLVRGKEAQPTHMPEFPEDRNRHTLSRPMILFALIRAVALSVSVAIAFGSGQPNADWMPIATLIAMKPTLSQSALAAEQRIVGALLGALIAGGFLLAMDEAEAQVALDISGRPYFVWEGAFTRERVGDMPTELVPHFFRSLAQSLGAALHLRVRGENAHHMIESCFKGVGRSLRQAIRRQGIDLPSTKGVL